MHSPTALILISVAAILAASPAFAQSDTTNRSDRNCTGSTLGTDPAAPCADDVMRDASGILPRVVVAPARPATPVVPAVPAVPVVPVVPGAPATPAAAAPATGAASAPAPARGTATR